MSIVKVIELIAESEDGFEDATKRCVEEAGRTLDNIRSVYVNEMQAIVDGNRVVRYRVNCKVSFVIDDARRAHP